MTTKPISQVLKEARELIRDPKKWARGTYGTKPSTSNGGRCIATALFSAPTNTSFCAAMSYIERAIGATEHREVWIWNDSHEHSDIQLAFAKAIEIAEADEAKPAQLPHDEALTFTSERVE